MLTAEMKLIFLVLIEHSLFLYFQGLGLTEGTFSQIF